MTAKLALIRTLGLPFLLSVPETLESQPVNVAPTPVLIFLHGLMEGPPTGLQAGLTAHGPLKEGSSQLATTKFVVAAPQLPERGDIWSDHAAAVTEIVRYLHDHCGGDPRRTYLTGFSFGGNGVFDVALLFPGLWAALWPVDPTRVPLSDPGVPVWLSSGEAARHRGSEFMSRLQLQPPGTGSEDRVYLDEGLDHVRTATSAYRNDNIYRWLLSKRLGTTGRVE